MDIDYKRNYYNCESFGHITEYYRNKRMIGQDDKLATKETIVI